MPAAQKIRIGTFNCENLFMRWNFLKYERGGMGRPKPVSTEEFIKNGGYINHLGFKLEDFGPIKGGQRKNTAKAILANDPDVVALQEVENLEVLKQFNSKYLQGNYGNLMLIDGNDARQIDVGLLSKHPIARARTHQFEKDSHGTIFSRDCLEADIELPDGRLLSLFVNHFKSQIGGGADKRQRQATQVANILHERFGPLLHGGDFAVVGDFNAGPTAPEMQPLLGLPGLENVIQTRIPDAKQRWTHFLEKGKKTEQLDYLLLSPTLAAKNKKGAPVIERRGLGDYATAYKGPRFPGVGPAGTEASDHCGVFMELTV
jgi:endonuclease/exonuclease/phosphatase family metal-dependent hydrolase